MNKIHLLVIDPQKDFCQPANNAMAQAMLAANNGISTPAINFVDQGGSLCVAGADQDTIRLAGMVDRLRNKIDDIHVTLDSHNEVDIAHPIFWVDSNGGHPDPFTIISEDDVMKGVWMTTSPSCRTRAINYVKDLAVRGRNPLCIWPPHCVIGTEGYAIQEPLANSLAAWCQARFKKVDYVTKGSNVFTEHYSAVQADVPDPSDPTTMLNTGLINILADADVILISGQALSHCVKWTITDIADNFGEENIKKFILLEDTCSNVTGFDQFGIDFVTDMKSRGMQTAKSDEYLV